MIYYNRYPTFIRATTAENQNLMSKGQGKKSIKGKIKPSKFKI